MRNCLSVCFGAKHVKTVLPHVQFNYFMAKNFRTSITVTEYGKASRGQLDNSVARETNTSSA